MKKRLSILLCICLLFSLVSAASVGTSDMTKGKVVYTPPVFINYSIITTNTSNFWDDLDSPTDLLLSMFSATWIDGTLDMNNNIIENILNLFVVGNATIGENLGVDGDINILAGGNILMGTPTASGFLDGGFEVTPNALSKFGLIMNNAANEKRCIGFYNDGDGDGIVYVYDKNENTRIVLDAGTGKLSVRDTTTSRIILDERGNILINTAAPSAFMDAGIEIKPRSRGKFGVLLEDTDGSRVLGFYLTGAGNGQQYIYDNAENLKILLNSVGDSYFNGGNVGIGTTTPTHKLNVVGNANITGNITAENVHLPVYISAHTNDTIAVGSAGVWYNVTFDQEVSEFKKRITHTYNDDTNTTFIIQDTGIYEITYTMSFEDSAAVPTSHIVTRITKNNVELNGFTIEEDLGIQNQDSSLHHSDLVSLITGDKIVLSFTSDDTTVSLTSHLTYGIHKNTGHLTIKRIA